MAILRRLHCRGVVDHGSWPSQTPHKAVCPPSSRTPQSQVASPTCTNKSPKDGTCGVSEAASWLRPSSDWRGASRIQSLFGS